MKLQNAAFLADENIHPLVVQHLRGKGLTVTTVADVGLAGRSDAELLRFSVAERQIVLTHDSDFGMLAVMAGEPIWGIIYLRPGHIDPEFTISSLTAVFQQVETLDPPFIIISEHKKDKVRIRIRKIE